MNCQKFDEIKGVVVPLTILGKKTEFFIMIFRIEVYYLNKLENITSKYDI